MAEQVFVDGVCVTDPSKKFDESVVDKIEIDSSASKYVSRGAYKLECALQHFNINPKDKVVVDIGSSTGGFSDVLLQNGAKKIYCIDTGKGQLHDKIRKSGRVEVYEETDFRTIEPALIEDSELVVIDVSFISIETIIKKLQTVFKNKQVKVISLIKPQFECGKDIAKKYKGVIKNKNVHIDVINRVIGYWTDCGFYVDGLIKSAIKGGDGNIEYLLLSNNFAKTNIKINIEQIVNEAFNPH